MSRNPLLLFAALVSLALAPIGLAQDGEANQDPESERAPSRAVELISEGEAPRRALRYDIEAEHTGAMLLTSNFNMRIMVNGQDQSPQPIPGQRMRMSLRAVDVERDGDVRYRAVIDNAEAAPGDFPPQMMEIITNALEPLEGTTIQGLMSARGLPVNISVEAPENAQPQAMQMLSDVEQIATQIGSPFPTEPVGVGARWRTAQTIAIGAFDIMQTTRYEVLSMDGDIVRLKVDVQQTADDQPIEAPGLPPEAEARLVSYAGTGQGESVVDLTGMAPIESFSETVSTWTVAVAMDQAEQSLDYRMTMSVRMEATEEE